MANGLHPDKDADKNLALYNDPSVHHPSEPSPLVQQNTYHQIHPQYYFNQPRFHSGGPYVPRSQPSQQRASTHCFPSSIIQPFPSILNGNMNHTFQGHSGRHPVFLSSNSFHPPPYHPLISPQQVLNPIDSHLNLSNDSPIVRHYCPPRYQLNTLNVPNQADHLLHHAGFPPIHYSNFGTSTNGMANTQYYNARNFHNWNSVNQANETSNPHHEQRTDFKSVLLDPDCKQCSGSFPQIDSSIGYFFADLNHSNQKMMTIRT